MWYADVPFWAIFPKPIPIAILPPKIAPHIPVVLRKVIQVPRHDQGSELSSIAFVAKAIGFSFIQKGPDYALWDTRVKYGTPIAAGSFLREIGNVSFLPTRILVNIPKHEISVSNLQPLQGPIPTHFRYVVVQHSAQSWTFRSVPVPK